MAQTSVHWLVLEEIKVKNNMATTRSNAMTEEASHLVLPDVPIPLAIRKLIRWDGSGGRKISEKQVKESNTWAVPCCFTRHVTYGLPPLGSNFGLPVADDPPLPPAPIPDRKSIGISSEVKDSSTPA